MACKLTQGGWLTARQIEAGRIAARQYVSREGKLFVRVFPDAALQEARNTYG